MNQVEQATSRAWHFRVTDETPGFSLLELWVREEGEAAFEEAFEAELPKATAEAVAREGNAMPELLEAVKRFMGLRYTVGEPGNEMGDACAFCHSMQAFHLPLSDGSPCPAELGRAAIAKATGA